MARNLATRNSENPLSPWAPFDELDRFFGSLEDQVDRWRAMLDNENADGAFTPLADIEETDDAFLVEIELAGVKRGDIELTTVGRRLTVTGERKEKERVGILRRRTRTVGRFRYEITLPGEFDAEDVTAGLEDGVLTVRLPKPETERPRRITVN